MFNYALVENRTPDPADVPTKPWEQAPGEEPWTEPDDDGIFGYCAYCGDPITYDDCTWQSLYIETEDGSMHTDCAEEWFKEFLASNYKIAKRER